MATVEQYGYTVARLRAMESRLLDDSVLQRLIDCEDLESAMKVLGETVYSSWLVELKSNTEFDKAI
ncbi:V-type ATPase subunit, partial [Aminobacterium sp. UBA5277]